MNGKYSSEVESDDQECTAKLLLPSDKGEPPPANGVQATNGRGHGPRASQTVSIQNNNVKIKDVRNTVKRGPQIFTSLAVSTGCLSYGICMAFTSSAIPSIMSQNSTLNITNDQTTWMSSLLALGALFGSLSAVFLMDAVGRKASLLAFSVMSLFIGWTLLMAASQAWQLYLGRFLLGLGAGMEITISPVYIHETTKPDMRDICGSFPQVMTALGIFCCYVMGRSLAWNWLSLASCGFLIPFTFGLYYIPESPPWLVYNDEEDLAFRSMGLIRGEEYDASREITRIKEILSLHNNRVSALNALDKTDNTEENKRRETEEQQHHSFHVKEIFQKPVLHPLLVILVLMFLLQFSGQGAVTFYTAQIFKDANCMLDPNNCALIIGVTYLISAVVSLILKNMVGRRFLLLISQSGMAVAMISLGVYFSIMNQLTERDETDIPTNNITKLEVDLDNISWLPLPLLMMFTTAFNLGLGSLTWVVATEILPVRSQGWTHTIANLISNLCWFIVTKTFQDIQNHLGLSIPFFFYGSVCLFGVVFIFIMLPETRGKTYEETARSFMRVNPIVATIDCPILTKQTR